ncbi:MAG: hypothetical protein JW855_05480 [Gammaproteobacteria bacterium]|nr:hypothetical protein [Gammaproteobacteria bacterium]
MKVHFVIADNGDKLTAKIKSIRDDLFTEHLPLCDLLSPQNEIDEIKPTPLLKNSAENQVQIIICKRVEEQIQVIASFLLLQSGKWYVFREPLSFHDFGARIGLTEEIIKKISRSLMLGNSYNLNDPETPQLSDVLRGHKENPGQEIDNELSLSAWLREIFPLQDEINPEQDEMSSGGESEHQPLLQKRGNTREGFCPCRIC